MWVLGGGLLEADDGHVYDTAALFDRTGELVARYRKIHLYDVDLPGQPPFRESATITPGEAARHARDGVLPLGLSICYDVRFPELYRGLMALGAEVLLVPGAVPVTRRARITGTRCCARARSRTSATWWRRGSGGRSASRRRGRRSYGNSWSSTRGAACWCEAPEEGDGVWFADLDLTELRRIRQTFPALQHRRLGLTC